jgi:hypothetical protein
MLYILISMKVIQIKLVQGLLWTKEYMSFKTVTMATEALVHLLIDPLCKELPG